MKNIAQRALSLTEKYSLLSVIHGSIEDGTACSCENCGRLISNIATIKSVKGTFNVGLDCLDTLLENNNLLDSESYLEYRFSAVPAIQKAKSLRAKILKAQKKNKSFTATLVEFQDGRFGFSFEQDFTWREGTEPMGWDYTFSPTYKELTLKYVQGLYKAK